MNTKDKGELSEAKVLSKLKERGFAVLTPFGDNQKYDLVFDEDGDFNRVQVKTGNMKNGSINFNCYTALSNTKENKSKTYSKNEIDCFMVYCPDTDGVYKVPVEDIDGSSKCLRVDDVSKYYNGDIDWAEDRKI
jgi:hypothetical protein